MKERPAVPDYLTTDMADQAGHILRWVWWTLVGTDEAGSALLKLANNGGIYEKITYFKPV